MTTYGKSFFVPATAGICVLVISSIASVHGQYLAQQNRSGRTNQPVAQNSRQLPITSRVTASRAGAARPVGNGASLGGLQRGLAAFAADMGRMPTGAEGLAALINRPAGARNWRGPYISTTNWRQAFTDPWGNPYRYTVLGTGRQAIYSITSDGRDMRQGTPDDLSIQW